MEEINSMLSSFPSDKRISLAMAYVPFQTWEDIYEPDVATDRGTIFKRLDLPFLGDGVIYNGK